MTNFNTTPTQKHIQKDGSKNASTKTCQYLEASTSNTYIRVFKDPQNPCQNHHKIGPKNLAKKIMPRTRKIIDFAIIYFALATLKGPENQHFGCFLGTLFQIPLRPLFRRFDLFLALGTLGQIKRTPKNTPKKIPKKTSKMNLS